MVLSRLSINCSKEKPSVPPDYASVSPDSTVLFSMPLKSSLSSSETYSSVALPDVPRHASSGELAPSLVKLRSFKNKGTLLKHTTSTVPDFIYNPFDLYQNPVQGTHSSNNLSISLQLDQDSVYLPGLFIEEKSSSTTLQYSNETNDTQEAAGKSSLSGSLVITVKSKNAILTQGLQVRLSCYSSEFVCMMDPKSKTRCVKLLRNEPTRRYSYCYPMIRDTINFETGSNSITLLSPGTHIYPFSFIIDPNSFPANVRSHIGSTDYRLESLATIVTTKSNFETIFLSKNVTVKKTLPPSNMMKYECITSEGSWRDSLLEYNLFISTKLVEFDRPFQLNLQLLKKSLEDVRVDYINLSVIQSISIPCVETNGKTFLKNSYVQTNTFPLKSIKKLDQNELCHRIDIPELVISSKFKSDVLNRTIHPYYCEESSLTRGSTENKRNRLKITHSLKIHIILKDLRGEDQSARLQLCLKVPILLVSQDMSSSLYLPPYEEFSSLKLTETLKDCSSDEDYVSPPEYSEAC